LRRRPVAAKGHRPQSIDAGRRHELEVVAFVERGRGSPVLADRETDPLESVDAGLQVAQAQRDVVDRRENGATPP
jgi:hypothetical protein